MAQIRNYLKKGYIFKIYSHLDFIFPSIFDVPVKMMIDCEFIIKFQLYIDISIRNFFCFVLMAWWQTVWIFDNAMEQLFPFIIIFTRKKGLHKKHVLKRNEWNN